jgi:hypothetical protein
MAMIEFSLDDDSRRPRHRGARTERHPIPANARKADTRPNNLLRSYI